jgi:hypothetical protein
MLWRGEPSVETLGYFHGVPTGQSRPYSEPDAPLPGRELALASEIWKDRRDNREMSVRARLEELRRYTDGLESQLDP